jgi:hypothetical protein
MKVKVKPVEPLQPVFERTLSASASEIAGIRHKIASQLGKDATDKQIVDRLAGMGYHRRDIAEALNG